MGLETFISLTLYMVITATTPGPNNILVLNSVVNYGYAQSKRLILGVYAGFAAIMILCGFGTHLLIELLPNTLGILKILGAGYVFYLAYKVAKSKPQGLESDNDNLGFFNTFLLQFVNVKIILYAVTDFLISNILSPNTCIGEEETLVRSETILVLQWLLGCSILEGIV